MSTVVARTASVRLAELQADLLADGRSTAADGSPSWMHRPSTVRWIAGELARAVPDRVERIIATGPGDAVLGAALGLATGVPFASASDSLTPGERVAVVAIDLDDATAFENPRADVVSRHAVWARRRSESALFVAPRTDQTDNEKEQR